MPHWLIHAAWIAARALAGLIGCLTFYAALFMYEDEEGNWQNRLENLWVSIHDRAKVTNSLAVALFNTISQKLVNAFNWVFGSRLVSARSISASINLSIASGFFMGIMMIAIDVSLHHDDLHDLKSLVGLAPIALFCIGMAILPSLRKTKMALVFSYSPLFLGICYMLYRASLPDLSPTGPLHTYLIGISASIFTLAFSLTSDLVVVAVIRKTFSAVSSAISMAKIISAVVMFTVLAIACEAVPALLGATAIYVIDELRMPDYNLWTTMRLIGDFSFMGNLITLIYCVIPVMALLTVLCHSAFWPLASRVVYPLCRYRIFGNRKILLAFGSLCIIFSLNLEHQGIKDILKLFS